jgi:hypothetical protein
VESGVGIQSLYSNIGNRNLVCVQSVLTTIVLYFYLSWVLSLLVCIDQVKCRTVNLSRGITIIFLSYFRTSALLILWFVYNILILQVQEIQYILLCNASLLLLSFAEESSVAVHSFGDCTA